MITLLFLEHTFALLPSGMYFFVIQYEKLIVENLFEPNVWL